MDLNPLHHHLLTAESDLQSYRKKHKLSEREIKEFRLFFVLRELDRIQRKELGKNSSAQQLTPFHSLMLSHSKIYRRTFQVSKRLKIPMTPVLKSPAHFLEDFQPFKASCEYPIVNSEMQWVLAKEPSRETVKMLYQVTEFNFPVFHDLMHAIYFVLIPPPTTGSLRNYYFFIEALAFVQEFPLAEQLGPHLASTLKSIKNIHRSFEGEWGLWQSMKPEERFCRSFLTCLGYLHDLSDEKIEKAMAPYWQPAFSKSLRFSFSFMQDIVPPWMKAHDHKGAASLRKLKSSEGLSVLKLSDFSFANIARDRKLQEKLYHWNRNLLK